MDASGFFATRSWIFAVAMAIGGNGCAVDDSAVEVDAGLDGGDAQAVEDDGGGTGSAAVGGSGGTGGAAVGGSGGTGGAGGSLIDSSVSDTGEGGSGGEGGVPREVSCEYNNECPTDETCIGGKCAAPVPCADSNDCRGSDDDRTICDNELCVVCAEDADCVSGYGENFVCTVNTCIRSRYCEQKDDCLEKEVCDTDASECVECVQDDDCQGDDICPSAPASS